MKTEVLYQLEFYIGSLGVFLPSPRVPPNLDKKGAQAEWAFRKACGEEVQLVEITRKVLERNLQHTTG